MIVSLGIEEFIPNPLLSPIIILTPDPNQALRSILTFFPHFLKICLQQL